MRVNGDCFIIVLIGAFISIFLNQLEAPKGWKIWSLQWALSNVQLVTLQKYMLSSCHQSACWIFSCFRNPSNSDYRSCNVRTSSFLWVRIHTGGWAHRQRVSTTFLTRNKTLTFCFLVLLTGFEPRSVGYWVRRYTNWATPSPTRWHQTKDLVRWRRARAWFRSHSRGMFNVALTNEGGISPTLGIT